MKISLYSFVQFPSLHAVKSPQNPVIKHLQPVFFL